MGEKIDWIRHPDWPGACSGDHIRIFTQTVCEGHYGHTAELTESQQAVMRVTTPDVGMKCYLEFTRGNKVKYTTETIYKPLGTSLTEFVANTLRALCPANCWPRNLDANIYHNPNPIEE